MSRIGYARVSSSTQNLDRQEDAFQALNLDRVFCDKASGRDAARPGLQEMLGYIRSGDTLVVESISRIARSTKDLLAIVEKLDAKGVGFVSLKESIDTSTPQGTFVMTVFAALAQLERESRASARGSGRASRQRKREDGRWADRQRPIPLTGIRSMPSGSRAGSPPLLR